ncbi:predicted protein [Naegleria gruberi]|uniref:Predicted protein n=1 Tax=Naegleria gruberi TaxID=5762 RepID=D2VMC0_NAEGR|nr:uncharacterized protein NAEGRDRAFT_70080 [Naegleria gruberi]EFC42037.1 predicted protein [Naegleria gruberi]|eukprot:XP_002674781.1 predicted protein [Naegleria gruberi strain NEG-M]
MTLHLSVDQDDEAYHWLMSYFAQHPYTQNCRHVSVLSSDNRAVSNMLGGLFGVFGSMFAPQNNSEETDKQIMFTPVDGVRHFFNYKGKLTWIYIEKVMPKGEEKKNREKLTITILARDKKILTDLVEEARSLFKEHKKDKTVIYSPSLDCYDWEELTRKPKRPLDSIILGDNILEDIVTDLKSFVDGSKFYYTRGIPYRRGVLLKGPPGTGKSSTVMAVAGELGLDIYVLNVSSNKLDDEKMARLLHKVPQKSIVLIEDVDSCESAIESANMKFDSDQHISVSGLLNSIDGLGAQEGRIIFLTTNHPEKLNEALIRPGRIDRKFHIGFANKNQIKMLFLNFYQGEENIEQLADNFTEKLSNAQITPAKLQGYFMKYKSNPKKAFENVGELSNESEF